MGSNEIFVELDSLVSSQTLKGISIYILILYLIINKNRFRKMIKINNIVKLLVIA